jgi:hypothetical protein
LEERFFVWLFFVCLATTIHAQTDTAFWFAAPEVTYNNGNIHGDRPIYLRFTALAQDAVVTISQPPIAALHPLWYQCLPILLFLTTLPAELI